MTDDTINSTMARSTYCPTATTCAPVPATQPPSQALHPHVSKLPIQFHRRLVWTPTPIIFSPPPCHCSSPRSTLPDVPGQLTIHDTLSSTYYILQTNPSNTSYRTTAELPTIPHPHSSSLPPSPPTLFFLPPEVFSSSLTPMPQADGRPHHSHRRRGMYRHNGTTRFSNHCLPTPRRQPLQPIYQENKYPRPSHPQTAPPPPQRYPAPPSITITTTHTGKTK